MFFVMDCEMWGNIACWLRVLQRSHTPFFGMKLFYPWCLGVRCVTATIIAKKIRIKPISFFPRNPTLEILGSEPLIEHLSQKGFSFALTTLKIVALIQIGIYKIDSFTLNGVWSGSWSLGLYQLYFHTNHNLKSEPVQRLEQKNLRKMR